MSNPAQEIKEIQQRLAELKSRINELGSSVDTYKAKTAAAMGGGVFLVLLALGAAYDLAANRALIWLPLGITRQMLFFITIACGITSAALFGLASLRERHRDRSRETLLSELEEEAANLIERIEELGKDPMMENLKIEGPAN